MSQDDKFDLFAVIYEQPDSRGAVLDDTDVFANDPIGEFFQRAWNAESLRKNGGTGEPPDWDEEIAVLAKSKPELDFSDIEEARKLCAARLKKEWGVEDDSNRLEKRAGAARGPDHYRTWLSKQVQSGMSAAEAIQKWSDENPGADEDIIAELLELADELESD